MFGNLKLVRDTAYSSLLGRVVAIWTVFLVFSAATADAQTRQFSLGQVTPKTSIKRDLAGKEIAIGRVYERVPRLVEAATGDGLIFNAPDGTSHKTIINGTRSTRHGNLVIKATSAEATIIAVVDAQGDFFSTVRANGTNYESVILDGATVVYDGSAGELAPNPFYNDNPSLDSFVSQKGGVLDVQVPKTTNVISVGVLVDTNAATAYDELALIDFFISVADQSYQDSGVAIDFDVVAVDIYDPYLSQSDMGLTLSDVSCGSPTCNPFSADNSEVIAWRDANKADLVVQIVRYGTTGGTCGIAWRPGPNGALDFTTYLKDLTYSVTGLELPSGTQCPSIVMAHEMGHNFGLSHDRSTGCSANTFFSYGCGYKNSAQQFGSVMSYVPSSQYVYGLSNPNRLINGYPLGVPIGQTNEAFAAQAVTDVDAYHEAIYDNSSSVTSHTVTPSAGAGGTISPDVPVTVTDGETTVFTITPNSGYQTVEPVGGTCGGSLSGTTYTTATITVSCSVTASFEEIATEVSLAEALDAPQLAWTTSGDASWFGQTSTTYDGIDAAQSGDILNNEVSRLITSVEGSGTLSFAWKVASEAIYDQLVIYIDDEPQDAISGDQDWVDVQLDLTSSGEHSIVWSYEKDFSVSALQDAAWVDLVSWEVAEAPSEPTLNAVTTLQTSVTQASATLEFTQGVGGPSVDSYTASCEPIVEESEARTQSAATEFAESNPEEPSYQRPRIVGGELANDGEFPFLVTVLPSGSLCGGSIISDRWVVTAAHCLEGLTASDVSVRAGSNQLFSGYTTYQAENIYLHPAYDNWTFDNDIALIQVSTAITAAKTASIDLLRSSNESSLLSDFDEVIVAGWGTTSSGGTTSSNLLKVSVDVQYPSTCRANSDYGPSEITDNMICAGVMGGGKDACQGDSGGPLVRYDGTGNPWLTGIVSWGYGCADADYPGVYTRVANYTDWITEKLVLSETGTSSPITVNGLTAGTLYRCSVAAFAGPASSSSGVLTILAGDRDGDGVLDYDDAFPNDPTETTDTDGEGLGDNLEGTLGTDINNPDTDGDGYTDYEEYVDGTDPLDDGDPGSGGLPVWLLIQAIQ